MARKRTQPQPQADPEAQAPAEGQEEPQAQAQEEPQTDWHALLIAALKEEGITVTARPNPKGTYATYLLEDGKTSIGYVHPQRKAVRVEAKMPKGSKPKGLKGGKLDSRNLYTGTFEEKTLSQAVAALKAAHDLGKEADEKKAAEKQKAAEEKAAKAKAEKEKAEKEKAEKEQEAA